MASERKTITNFKSEHDRVVTISTSHSHYPDGGNWLCLLIHTTKCWYFTMKHATPTFIHIPTNYSITIHFSFTENKHNLNKPRITFRNTTLVNV